MGSQTITAWRRISARSPWWTTIVWMPVFLNWLICGPASAGTLWGTAILRERIGLPEDAVFEAELQDMSRAGAPATVLGRTKLDPAGRSPDRFEIGYDDAALQAGRRYSVRATITHQGRPLYTTDRIHPVLDGLRRDRHLMRCRLPV